MITYYGTVIPQTCEIFIEDVQLSQHELMLEKLANWRCGLAEWSNSDSIRSNNFPASFRGYRLLHLKKAAERSICESSGKGTYWSPAWEYRKVSPTGKMSDH
ncbi:hypothetical protein AB6A40_011260 [Gnathostoma spinigerum]|uniref:Uncharacterized protein n=1 Tax=Gnathostoma spinigerum TaxID=75299 RepID=A0ABD6F2N3_9BILA